MSGYIEKDRDGDFFNPASNTVEINPSNGNDGSSAYTDMKSENRSRWNWLIEGWEKMSFKERMSIFFPYLHYVNPRDNWKTEFDERFQKEIVDTAYTLCRNISDIKFDPDGQGVPNIIMVFDPIDISSIPDGELRTTIRSWGKQMGFIKCHCGGCSTENGES